MKDARYFPHDANARHDPKIKAIVRIHGIIAYAYYFLILENMREETGCCLKDKIYLWESLAGQCETDVEKIKSFVDDCIKFDLFERDGDKFYSPSLVRRMAKLDAMRERKRAGAYEMHKRLGHNITRDGLEPSDD